MLLAKKGEIFKVTSARKVTYASQEILIKYLAKSATTRAKLGRAHAIFALLGPSASLKDSLLTKIVPLAVTALREATELFPVLQELIQQALLNSRLSLLILVIISQI